MKTLIVDDQYEHKAEIIARLLKEIGAPDFTLVSSMRDALKAMRTEAFDLLVLDLHIPSEPGEAIDQAGGQSLLEFIEVNDRIRRPKGVVAVTSHTESYASSLEFFRRRGWTLVLGVDDEEYLKGLFITQKNHMPSTEQFDVIFIAALEKTELAAIRDLPCSWEQYKHGEDVGVYYCGVIRLKDGTEKRVLAASLPRMGLVAASAVTTKLCIRYCPSLVVMTGIAAGIKGEVEMGDILVADPTWDWGSGKLTVRDGEPILLSDPNQMSLDAATSAHMRNISANRLYLDEIQAGWRGEQTGHRLSLHVGPIASGAVVLEDPGTVQLIKSQHRKTIGVEMEAYGVMAAAFYAKEAAPKCVVIKAVCDFADPYKDSQWQSYAAYVSAQFAYRYVRDYVV